MYVILIAILVLLLVGALSSSPVAANWGYAPSGVMSVAFAIVLVILLLTGRL